MGAAAERDTGHTGKERTSGLRVIADQTILDVLLEGIERQEIGLDKNAKLDLGQDKGLMGRPITSHQGDAGIEKKIIATTARRSLAHNLEGAIVARIFERQLGPFGALRQFVDIVENKVVKDIQIIAARPACDRSKIRGFIDQMGLKGLKLNRRNLTTLKTRR